MDWRFHLGLSIGIFITGIGVLVGIRNEFGIVFSAFAIVWGFLFVNPKSPIKRHCWSVSDKISIIPLNDIKFGYSGDEGYPLCVDNYKKMVRIHIGIRMLSNIAIESMQLKLKGKKFPSNWQPASIPLDYHQYVYFGIPDCISIGKQVSAYVVIGIRDGIAKSPKFIIDVH